MGIERRVCTGEAGPSHRGGGEPVVQGTRACLPESVRSHCAPDVVAERGGGGGVDGGAAGRCHVLPAFNNRCCSQKEERACGHSGAGRGRAWALAWHGGPAGSSTPCPRIPMGRRPQPHSCQLPRSYKALLPCSDSESKARVLLAIRSPPVARPFNISLLQRRGGRGTSEAWSDSSAE